MNFLKRCCESKRECLTYIIVTLWISIGILGTYYETNFAELAAYFISLTGFAGAYMYGESVRKSGDSSIFKGGKSSKRELMIYLTVFLWLIIGIFTIIISLFIIFTHRSNIQRMLNGNENRFNKAMIFRKNT